MVDGNRVCASYSEKGYSGGIFTGNDPLNNVYSTMMFQSILMFFTSQMIHFVLKPLKQPKILSNVLSAFILGPSFMSQNKAFKDRFFQPKEMLAIVSISRIGILYFIFISTVKMDKDMLLRTTKKAWNIGLTGFLIPFTVTTVTTYLLRGYILEASGLTFIFTFSSNMSLSYFSVVAHALNELNLINSELGQLALSCAIIKDAIGWILLASSSLIIHQGDSLNGIIASKLSMLGLVLFAFFVLRPAIQWIIRTTPEGRPVKQIYTTAILLGPLVMGMASEAFDKTFLPGALLMGLIVPAGPPLGSSIVEKCELVNTNFFIPFLFVRIASYTNIYAITDWKKFVLLNLVIISSYLGKTVATVVGMLFSRSSFRTAVLLSFILNLKGVIDYIAVLRWRTVGIIDDEFLTTFVLSHVVMTVIITPLISIFYKPHIRPESTHWRDFHMKNLQTTSLESELRILCCLHFEDNVHSVITLLKVTNTSGENPICAYVVHLVELVGRSVPLLLHYNTRKKRIISNSTDRIMRAVMKYSKTSYIPVNVVPYTIIAPYNTMHENICNLAKHSYIPLIVLPFRKSRETNAKSTSLRNFTLNVQEYAPCTVGILFDRGLPRSLSSTQLRYNVAVLFMGGPDDREAMSLAARMSRNPDVSITVFRILMAEENEMERSLDDSVLKEFMARNIGNSGVVCYEIVAENTMQLVDAVREANNYDLVIVGKRRGPKSRLEKEMKPWMEYEELGVIGDMIASGDFRMMSVLVIQSFVDFEASSLHCNIDMTSESSYFSST
ncbi:cation/H(+) antiporter 15-like [Pistacia vera]|uniref:cation/H(+) antiporter 15-like n=1 Tax=Pistacia vera TaxID=55513 RepID=UPI0012630767|nr:cation/H(+) antiporter 15-like [Pistacia vera]